jgi:hypothetical protein
MDAQAATALEETAGVSLKFSEEPSGYRSSTVVSSTYLAHLERK